MVKTSFWNFKQKNVNSLKPLVRTSQAVPVSFSRIACICMKNMLAFELSSVNFWKALTLCWEDKSLQTRNRKRGIFPDCSLASMKRENGDHTAAVGFINMNYRIRWFSKHLSDVNLVQEKKGKKRLREKPNTVTNAWNLCGLQWVDGLMGNACPLYNNKYPKSVQFIPFKALSHVLSHFILTMHRVGISD